MLFGSSSRHVQVPTKRLPSSPPRLLCRSPGPGPSVSSLSCPKPSLSWVMKPTLAHTRALTASHAPVSPTDTAGTHSHFTHAQTQPHQSTALLRMGKVHHLVTQVASGSSLHSAPLHRRGRGEQRRPLRRRVGNMGACPPPLRGRSAVLSPNTACTSGGPKIDSHVDFDSTGAWRHHVSMPPSSRNRHAA